MKCELDEYIITDSTALRSKTYCYLKDDIDENE